MQLGRWKTILAIGALIALGVFCYVALWRRWPSESSLQVQAVFSFLQFSGTVFLLLATVLYTRAAWALVESQNRAPEIYVFGEPTLPNIDGPEFPVIFTVHILNPSIRATSLKVEKINVNGRDARTPITLSYDDRHSQEWITINAGTATQVELTARFADLPYGITDNKCAEIVFRDAFRGELPSKKVNW